MYMIYENNLIFLLYSIHSVLFIFINIYKHIYIYKHLYLLTYILPRSHMIFLIPDCYTFVSGPAMLVNIHCSLIAS